MREALKAEKVALRTRMAGLRDAAFHAPDAGAQMQAACDHALDWLSGALPAGQVLSGYMPIHSEIDPRPVMASHSGPVCVPVVPGRDMALEFHRWTPDTPMQPGQFKALVPVARDPLVPQILIVPLLAFDRRGFRLGYGGGFYDRTLEGLRAHGKVLAMGLAFDIQEVPRVPTEATDQPLDVIITPSGPIPPH